MLNSELNNRWPRDKTSNGSIGIGKERAWSQKAQPRARALEPNDNVRMTMKRGPAIY